jgi:hypothetical protein
MVLGARQRREAEKFQDMDRHFLFDDLDVARDRLRRVGREAENVAGIGDDPVPPPREQHLAVFPNLVLALLGAQKRIRIDVLKTEEHERRASPRRLLDEIRNAVTELVSPLNRWPVRLAVLPNRNKFKHAAVSVAVTRLLVGTASTDPNARPTYSHSE